MLNPTISIPVPSLPLANYTAWCQASVCVWTACLESLCNIGIVGSWTCSRNCSLPCSTARLHVCNIKHPSSCKNFSNTTDMHNVLHYRAEWSVWKHHRYIPGCQSAAAAEPWHDGLLDAAFAEVSFWRASIDTQILYSFLHQRLLALFAFSIPTVRVSASRVGKNLILYLSDCLFK